jgi:hypothetical protein
MSQIRRWFPVSHEYYNDPEIWEMIDQLGDRSNIIWQLMVAAADLRDGVIGPQSDSNARQLAWRSHSTPAKVRKVWDYATEKGWIEVGKEPDRVMVTVNHSKFHKTRGEKKTEEETKEGAPLPTFPPTDQPELPKKKIKKEKASQLPPFREVYLTPALVQWSEKEGHRAPGDLVEAFEDYHRAKGSRFTDWEAAFRTWIRNDAKWNQNGSAAPEDPWAAYGK